MTPRSWQRLGASVALSLILGACSGQSATDRAKNDDNELAKSLVGAASASLAQNDPATAASYYRGALAREPENPDAAVGLMQSLRLIGGLDEARAVADKAVAANPDNATVAAEAGKIKLAVGQLDDAVKLLKRAVAADPKDWRSLSALGMAYDRIGQYGLADQTYRAALADSPDSAAVLNNYALSRAMANDLEGARILLQRAATAPDADMRVRQNLALVYALSGDMGKAEELARHDLPPSLVGEELDYYRHLAASAATPLAPADPAPSPLPQDRSAIDSLDPALASASPLPDPAAAAAAKRALAAGPLADFLPAPPHRAPEAASELADVPAQDATPPAALPNPAPVAVAPAPDAVQAPARTPKPAAVASLGPARPEPTRRPGMMAERFTVQLGTFLSEASARRAIGVYALKGVALRTGRIADRHGREWYVVRAGEFETGAAAHRLLHLVQASGCTDAFVVRHAVSTETRA